jgi:hypothetical protein
MAWTEAFALLGLTDATDESTVRDAFRARLRTTHPDLNDAADATERTVALTTAYRVALAHLHQPPPAPGTPDRTADAATEVTRPPEEAPVQVHLVDGETIGIAAPAVEVVPMLIEAAHQLGDITYLDPGAGLLEVVVEFVGAPTSSVVLSLQGRATGVTEVFCTVEPLSGGEAPSDAAVTHLLWRTLRGEDPTE